MIELICLSPGGAPAPPQSNVEALDSQLSSKKEPGQSVDSIIRDIQTREPGLSTIAWDSCVRRGGARLSPS